MKLIDLPSLQVHHGSCLDVLRGIADCSIDSIVTDPPYGLSDHSPEDVRLIVESWILGLSADPRKKRGFMGKEWDAFVPGPEVWRECFRVLKPGAHIAVFAGSRTVDLMGLSIRLAGFEIRDQLQWIYGSGFPKSLDVSKAIDKAAGVEREVVGSKLGWPGKAKDGSNQRSGFDAAFGGSASGSMALDITAPATPAAKQWRGWGTALKPAHEPIILARKPLAGTVAENVQEWGTGGLNVDGCRVEAPDPDRLQEKFQSTRNAGPRNNSILGADNRDRREGNTDASPLGRWPANIILDEQAGEMMDAQAGNRPGMSGGGKHRPDAQPGMFGAIDSEHTARGDDGGPSRFFYSPKASTSERHEGCSMLRRTRNERKCRRQDMAGTWEPRAINRHPTVKPVELIRWLIRLVTPPGGLTLDIFLGSGSSGCAAALEGFRFIGCEREGRSAYVSEARILYFDAVAKGSRKRRKAPQAKPKQQTGQLSLLEVLSA